MSTEPVLVHQYIFQAIGNQLTKPRRYSDDQPSILMEFFGLASSRVPPKRRKHHKHGKHRGQSGRGRHSHHRSQRDHSPRSIPRSPPPRPSYTPSKQHSHNGHFPIESDYRRVSPAPAPMPRQQFEHAQFSRPSARDEIQTEQQFEYIQVSHPPAMAEAQAAR